MLQIATAVTHAPRQGGSNYLPETLRQITRAGFEPPVVFAEEGSPGAPGVALEVSGDLLGSYGNFRRALACLYARRPGVDAYAIFQDDILLSSGIAQWLRWPIEPSKIGVLSLYTAAPNHRRAAGWRALEPHLNRADVCATSEDGSVVRLPSRTAELLDSFGALAYVLPRESARRFLDNPPGRGTLTRTDFWAGRFCVRESLAYLVHSPSLAMHAGDDSTFADHGSLAHRQAAVFAPSTEALQCDIAQS